MFNETVLVGIFVTDACLQKIIACNLELFDIIELCQNKQNALSDLLVVPEVPCNIFGKPIKTLISLTDILLADYNDDSEFFHLLDRLVSVQGVHDIDLSRSTLLKARSVNQTKFFWKSILLWSFEFRWFPGA